MNRFLVKSSSKKHSRMSFTDHCNKVKAQCADTMAFLGLQDAIKQTGFDYVVNQCCTLTKTYDKSHDVIHHLQVCETALQILLLHDFTDQLIVTNSEKLLKMIVYASLLHDTIDHKYPENLEDKIVTVNSTLEKVLGSLWIDTKWIIDNMSYTKEVKYGYKLNPDPVVQLARNIVSDSDKLYAIGPIGINRCREFNTIRNPNLTYNQVTNLILDHCKEKLIGLKDNFIRTNPGKKLAQDGHDFIQFYIETVNKSKLEPLIKN